MSDECLDEDIAIKSFFMGPSGENFEWFQQLLDETLEVWNHEKTNMNGEFGKAISQDDRDNLGFRELQDKVDKAIRLLRSRLQSEAPCYSPKFMSHMVFEPSVAALLGHIVTLLHNPNLVSSEVSKKSQIVEDEAVAELVEMLGYSRHGRGHFTSGGTVANIEALWRARFRLDHWLALGAAYDEDHPETKPDWMKWAHMGWKKFYEFRPYFEKGEDDFCKKSFVLQNPFTLAGEFQAQYGKPYLGPVLLVPSNKHYSWQKGLSLLGFGQEAFWQIELDEGGRLDVEDLRLKIEKARWECRPILMVVSVAGTTEMGAMDPVDKVQELLDEYRDQQDLHIWHHVDGAYGGFFCSLLKGYENLDQLMGLGAIEALQAIHRADSVTIDPHKLGYVPYACGAILFPSEKNYETSSFAAPYLTDHSNRWMKTIEGSRAATGAGATWMAAKTVGFHGKGLGHILDKGISARKRLQELLKERLPQARYFDDFDTNVFCFALANEGDELKEVNDRSLRIYNQLNGKGGFYISKTTLKSENYGKYISRLIDTWQGKENDDRLVFIRMVFMNPFLVSKELHQVVEEKFINELKAFC